jgi:hypothetical protein
MLNHLSSEDEIEGFIRKREGLVSAANDALQSLSLPFPDRICANFNARQSPLPKPLIFERLKKETVAAAYVKDAFGCKAAHQLKTAGYPIVVLDSLEAGGLVIPLSFGIHLHPYKESGKGKARRHMSYSSVTTHSEPVSLRGTIRLR